MSYEATAFNVMIASPGDVASERAIVRDVVYEWNTVHSHSRRIVLLPIGWESHSSPEMGARPQEILNNQIVDKCDLLVGVFWTRIGTPTAEFKSGTVEEIERHIEAGKPIMLYFSSQPVALDSVDTDQYAELKAFKETCKSRGLFDEYEGLSDFKDKLYRHLQMKLNEHEMFRLNGYSLAGEAIVESSSQLPELSSEGKALLKAASVDGQGHVMCARYIGGTSISAGGTEFVKGRDRREVAKWEAAIEELVDRELLIERGHKGELFEITNLGYRVADMIVL